MVAVAEQSGLLMPWRGERLKELRELRGYKIIDLERLSGVSKATISRLETDNQKPGWDQATKLADALMVSIDAFRQPLGESPLRKRIEDEDD